MNWFHAGFGLNARVKTRLGLLSCFLVVACAEGSGGVTRMVGGVRYEGRFVNPEAYAAFLLGVEREAQGDYPGAVAAYLEAHAEDPDSPEIWARIGAVRCISSAPQTAVSAAQSAFDHGLKANPEYFGTYLERARCRARSHDPSRALPDAIAAVARRPEDEAANLLVAELLQSLGRRAEARAFLEAFQSYRAGSPRFRQALERARQPKPGTPPSPVASAASSGHSGAFAELRAGHPENARQRAELELRADPTNSDAWVAALVACDALHDDLCFEATLKSLGTPHLLPSNTALSYLQELLTRRTGTPIVF